MNSFDQNPAPHTRLLLLAMLVVLGLCAASCSDDDDARVVNDEPDVTDDQETPGSDGDEMVEEPDDEEMAEESAGEEMAEEPDDEEMAEESAGGSLVIGTTQVARHLNGTVQSGLATAVPGTQLNASPLWFDENWEPQPYLAETWDMAADGLSLTLNLVDDATFHDGHAITSADVKFSIETAQASHPFKPMFAPVESVDTPDDHTVVINLAQPHPAILLAMSPALLPVIPEHIFNDGQPVKEHPRNSDDFIGSGPFKLVEFNPSEVIRLDAYEDFFLGRPILDEIIIQTFPDENSLVLSLENGDVDMAGMSSFVNVERLRGAAGLTVTNQGHEGLGAINWVEFNLADEALANVHVRHAIAYAIDADKISALNGNLFPRQPSPITISSPFFHEGINSYDFSLEEANRHLELAGHPGGDGIGELEITYIPGPDAIQKNVAEYIVQALEEIGITVKLRAAPDFPTWAGWVASGDFDMTMNNVWNWGDPVIGVHRSYLSSNRVGAIWTNNTGYENAEVDALLDKAGQAVDSEERADLYRQFQDVVASEVPIYWLNNTTPWQVFPEGLINPPTTIWGQMSPMHTLQLPS